MADDDLKDELDAELRPKTTPPVATPPPSGGGYSSDGSYGSEKKGWIRKIIEKISMHRGMVAVVEIIALLILAPFIMGFDPAIGPVIVLVLLIGFILELFGVKAKTTRKFSITGISIWAIFIATGNDVLLTSMLGFLIVFFFIENWLVRSERKYTNFIAFIGFIAVIIIVLMLYSNILLGTQDRSLSQLWSEGLFEAGTGESKLRNAKFNQLTALLKGEYDPDQQAWETRRVQDDYIVPDDAGVRFSNIGPQRSRYVYPDRIKIEGDVEIISLFEGGDDVGKDTVVELDVEVPVCSTSYISEKAEKISEKLGATDIPLSFCEDWVCDLPGEERVATNTFKVTKAYNRFFVCEHDSFELASSDFDISVNPRIVWRYTTHAISGRQIFVAHPDTLAKVEDLRANYNIQDAAFEPWSISDGTVDFGIGFDRDIDFLRAEGPGDVCTASKVCGPEVVDCKCVPGDKDYDRFTSYFLGTSIKNEGKGDIIGIEEFELHIPHDENIVLLNHRNQPLTLIKAEANRLALETLTVNYQLSTSGIGNITTNLKDILGYKLEPSGVLDIVKLLDTSTVNTLKIVILGDTASSGVKEEIKSIFSKSSIGGDPGVNLTSVLRTSEFEGRYFELLEKMSKIVTFNILPGEAARTLEDANVEYPDLAFFPIIFAIKLKINQDVTPDPLSHVEIAEIILDGAKAEPPSQAIQPASSKLPETVKVTGVEISLDNLDVIENQYEDLAEVIEANVNQQVRFTGKTIREDALMSIKSGNFVYSHSEYQNEDQDTGRTIPINVFKLADNEGLPIDLDNPLDISGTKLEPGAFETFYIKLSIKEDFLQNTAYQSFFVKGKLTYDFESREKTTIKIEAPLALGGAEDVFRQ